MKTKVLTNNPTFPKSRKSPPLQPTNVAIILAKNKTTPHPKLILKNVYHFTAFMKAIIFNIKYNSFEDEKKQISFIYWSEINLG